jgi:hypothetical protein
MGIAYPELKCCKGVEYLKSLHDMAEKAKSAYE